MNKIILLLPILIQFCSDTAKINYAISIFPEKLEPNYNLYYDGSQIASQIYERLVVLDNDLKSIKPHLAKRWVISDDKKEYTFYLRKNVYFHDGTKLSAYSVKKSYEWFRQQDDKSEIYRRIESFQIIDSTAFQFKLNEPYSIFLYTLAAPQCFEIMSERSIEKYDSTIYYQLVGSGPYYVHDYKRNEFILLKKFDEYWNENAKIEEINFIYYEAESDIVRDFENNRIDIKYLISSYSIDRLLWKGNIKYKTGLPIDIFFIGFNNQTYPFNNKKVRKALLKAINVPKIVYNTNRGNAIVAKGPLSPTFFKYKEKEQDKYNPEEAKKILKENGINNITLNFDYLNTFKGRSTPAELIRNELRQLNINLNIDYYNSWAELDRAVLSDSAQMFYTGGRSDIIGDAYNLLYGFFYSTSELNFLRYKNPLVDRWLDEAILEHDKSKRDIIYEKTVNQILEDTPAVFLQHVVPNFAYNSKRIKNLDISPYGIVRFDKLELQ